MRNGLPKYNSRRKHECGVINLDDISGMGTHWVGYYCKNNVCYYFDSFGNLQPPKELIDYLGNKCTIYFNYKIYQTAKTVNCGHLCMSFLYHMYEKYH